MFPDKETKTDFTIMTVKFVLILAAIIFATLTDPGVGLALLVIVSLSMDIGARFQRIRHITDVADVTWYRVSYIEDHGGPFLESFDEEDAMFELLGYPSEGNQDEIKEIDGMYAESWIKICNGKVEQYTTQEACDLLANPERLKEK